MNLLLNSIERPGVVVVDRRQKILICNKRFAELGGYENVELIGNHLNVVVPERFRDAHNRYFALLNNNPDQAVTVQLKSAMSSHFGKSRQVPMLKKDGKEVVVEITLKCLLTDAKELIVLAFVEDTDEVTHFALDYLKASLNETLPDS